MIIVRDVNSATLELYAIGSKEEFRQTYCTLLDEKSIATLRQELMAIAEGRTTFECESVAQTSTGKEKEVLLRWRVAPGYEESLSRVWVSTVDCTELNRAQRTLRARETQLLTAKQIQERLWPPGPPELPGFDIAAACHPAEYAAGDYFDYLAMPDGSFGFVVADVSGHGFGPALLMASLDTLLRTIALSYSTIDETLVLANRALIDIMEEHRFVTLLFGLLDPRKRSFVYVNAGHPTGYVLNASGDVTSRLQSTTIPLGVLPDLRFDVSDPILLEPGDLILMVTDGIQEARSPEGTLFGTGRVLEAVRRNQRKTARGIIDNLCQAACEFCDGEKPKDDVTVVVVKVESTSQVRKPE
jgi:serine phosphatase RsbU (regulator of sigma subunit)